MSKETELLNSPLGKAYHITPEDLQRAKELLEGKMAGAFDFKTAIALLFAMALSGSADAHVLNKIKTLKPNDKNVHELFEKGQRQPKDAVKELLEKLKYEVPRDMVKDFDMALLDVARKLEIKDPRWLKKVIQFESHGKPDVKNPVSTARGLIQFLNSTSKSLGYGSSKDLVKKHSTAIDQLYGPVYKYLSRYKPFPTEQSLYMAVFRPSDMYKNPTKIFPKKVRKLNPGIRTIQDYVNKVREQAKSELAMKVASNHLADRSL